MDNKLLLMVNFAAIDKLTGPIRNIMSGGKAGAASLKAMKTEARDLEKQLKDVRGQLVKGLGSGAQLGALVEQERRLAAATAEANQKLAAQKAHVERIGKIQTRLTSVAQSMTSIGQNASMFISAPLIAFGVTAVQASREANMAMAQTNASLASMGPVAGRSLAQLQAQADLLMKSSLFDDDEILRKVTANMLTFGKVTGRTFDRAQLAAVDLATKLGGDLQGATIMVGKALNDPVKGITALTRVGVSFTSQQKDLVRSLVASGKAAEAQGLILAELEKQYGGSGKAARKADPFAAAMIDFGEFQQAVGEKLIPQLLPLVTVLTDVLAMFNKLSPGVQKTLIIIAGVATVLGPVILAIGGVVGGIALMAPLVPFLAAGFMALTGPVGLFIMIFAALAYAIYANWDKIKAAFNAGVEWVKNTFNALPGWFKTIGGLMMEGLVSSLNPLILVNRLLSIARSGMDAFKNYFGIKSPSRLFMAMGGHMTEGLARGLEGGQRRPLAAMGRMATGIAGAGALALAPPALATGPAGGARGAGAGGPVTMNVTIRIDGASGDPRALAVQIKRELDALAAIDMRGGYADV